MTNNIIKQLFELRGELPKKVKTASFAFGSILFIGIWAFITEFGLVPKGILPSPIKIVASLPELHFDYALMANAIASFKLNVLGLLEAIIITIPLGFVIGLFPIFREMASRYIAAVRFLPLSAAVGIFIAWFGIDTNMKIQFLAFSIFIYLLPAVIQRLEEVEGVYVDTVKTLGASKWQTIKTVFMPGAISKIFDDIRVLSALSWTYIIIAELVNASGGGIGALAYKAARQSRMDQVFAILIVIMIIGLIQDRILRWLDKMIFPYKYATKEGGVRS